MNLRHTLILSALLCTLTVTKATLPSNFVNLFPDGSLFASPAALLIARSLRQRVVNSGGCNINVCYAIDGSGSILPSEFTLQKQFVEFVTAIIAGDGTSGFAGTQYGLRNVDISKLTSDANGFLLKVEAAQQAYAPRTFIAAGLGFCIQELRARPEDANKIVLIGDGRSNFGGDPVPIARRFRYAYDGDICAIGIGFRDNSVLRGITGSSTRVLGIHGYFELLDIVDQIVVEVCGLH